MFEALNDLVEKQKEFKKEMMKSGKAAVKAALKEIFDNFPQIEALRWTQYTPYFNDGDACTFSVNEVDLKLVDREIDPELDDDEAGEDGWIDSYSIDEVKFIKDNDLRKAITKIVKQFEDAIQSMDEAMEESFGDHVRVIATRSSIEVEEVDHD